MGYPHERKAEEKTLIEVRQLNESALRRAGACGDFIVPSGPLDIEIGCGVGWHPIRYALAYPGRYLVAIEHTREKFRKFEARFRNHFSDREKINLLPVHANAMSWIVQNIAPESVDRYFILYPNPATKTQNNWAARPFMAHLIKTLKPGGEIRLATNLKDYAAEAERVFRDVWKLKINEVRAFDFDSRPQGYPRTHFEKKFLLSGQTCFDLNFSKLGV